MRRFFFTACSSLLVACGPSQAVTLRPELAFSIGSDVGLTAARDLTVDPAGAVFIFDYDDYRIRKFDQDGQLTGTFGGSPDAGGDFFHLMAINAAGDSLVALDGGGVSVFDLEGNLRSKRSFSDTVVCDLPRIHTSGVWAGSLILDETAENLLTLRNPGGSVRAQVAGYPLGDVFPGVEPGGFFFIQKTEALSFHYDFLPDGRLVWASSDRVEVSIRGGGTDSVVFSSDEIPVPFPPDSVEAMRARQADLGPPLFMNVPEEYQLIQHLFVDETGDIWVYVLSLERSGFLQLSNDGREVGFYPVEADFDVGSARIVAANGNLYFMVTDQAQTGVYVVTRP